MKAKTGPRKSQDSDRPTTKLKPLEFTVFRARPSALTKDQNSGLGEEQAVLACCSGGADSVALVHVLARLQKRWRFQFEIAYVHHGETPDVKLSRYRDRAAKLVEKTAKKLGANFVLLHGEGESPRSAKETGAADSEAALRTVRFQAIENHAQKARVDVIVMGHHADDLLETRLIRLLRGTGPQGFTSMTSLSKTAEGRLLWRPFLTISRVEIEAYLADLDLLKNVAWFEDPSNRDARYLRNAIREKLLPQIESLRTGGVKSLARSFDLIAEFIEGNPPEAPPPKLDRAKLMELDPRRRRQRLAEWVLSLGVRGFSKSHLEEMLKRIDSPRRRVRFELCGRVWLMEDTIRLVGDGR